MQEKSYLLYQKIGDHFFCFLAWVGSSSYGFAVISCSVSEKLAEVWSIKVVTTGTLPAILDFLCSSFASIQFLTYEFLVGIRSSFASSPHNLLLFFANIKYVFIKRISRCCIQSQKVQNGREKEILRYRKHTVVRMHE